VAKTLTDISIKNLKPGPTPREVAVGGARGLYVWVGATGAKSFVVRYRLNGKPQKLTLGRWLPPEDRKETATDPQVGDPMSLASARKLAADTMLQLSRGRDPGAAKRDDNQAKRQATANTFEAIATEYLKRECGVRFKDGTPSFDPSKKRSGPEQYRMLQRQVFPTLGDKPVTEIRKSDIVRLLDRLADGELKNDKGKLIEGGEIAADRCLALVRRILNWHAARSDDFHPPLLKGLARTKTSERARERILSDVELRIVWETAGEDAGPFGALVRFLLLTGARRAESAEMPWSEIDGTDWVLPPARDKVKKGIIRPLSEAAREVLKARPRIEGCEYVFSNDGGRPMTGYSKPKARLDAAVLAKLRETDPKAKPLENWTLHDLRRTARSLLARAGVSTEVAEECLGHKRKGVEGVYNRYAYAVEMKAAYEDLAELIQWIVNPPTGSTLPPFQTEGKKRGRPQRAVSFEIVRELTAGEIALHEATRDRGGKPIDHYSRALLDGWAIGQRAGMGKREWIRDFFQRADPELDDEDVREIENQLNRLLRSE
jgi:integrase